MRIEEHIKYMRAYKGEQVEIDGRHLESLRHGFDLTDETVDVAIACMESVLRIVKSIDEYMTVQMKGGDAE